MDAAQKRTAHKDATYLSIMTFLKTSYLTSSPLPKAMISFSHATFYRDKTTFSSVTSQTNVFGSLKFAWSSRNTLASSLT